MKYWIDFLTSKRLIPLFFIILFNLQLLLIFGGYSVYDELTKREDDSTEVFILPTPPPPPPPPIASQPNQIPPQASSEPDLDPQPEVSIRQTQDNLITTTSSTSLFHLNPDLSVFAHSHSPTIQLDPPRGKDTKTFVGVQDPTANLNQPFSPFGGEASDGILMLTGYLYDFKQTRDRKDTGMDIKKWEHVLHSFADHHFHQEDWSGYYRSKNEVSTGSIAIPLRPSSDVLAAFHVQSEVQPRLWAICYEATVVAPDEGDYSFSGFADNVLCVAIDGNIVLDAGLTRTTDDFDLKQTYPDVWCTSLEKKYPWGLKWEKGALLRKGRKFRMHAGKPRHMTVVIGDDGGVCCFYLFIMRSDLTYEKTALGTPILPYFHLTPTTPNPTGDQPPHALEGSAWNPGS